jgi:uncharacterized coiled-coil protein SlyX
MNGSKKELEERLAAQEKILRDMAKSLEAARRMIEETRKILDAAKESDDKGKRPKK